MDPRKLLAQAIAERERQSMTHETLPNAFDPETAKVGHRSMFLPIVGEEDSRGNRRTNIGMPLIMQGAVDTFTTPGDILAGKKPATVKDAASFAMDVGLAGFGAGAPKGALRSGGARSKASLPMDEATGLPLNKDGTVTLYHATNPKAAAKIRETGRLQSAGEPDVYLSTAKGGTGYGDEVVGVRVDPRKLVLDDEFPDGRMDFRMDAGRPGGDVSVRIEPISIAGGDDLLAARGAPPTKASLPMDEASRMARAKEMGFRPDIGVFYGSKDDISKFNRRLAGANSGSSAAKEGVSVAVGPEAANVFAGKGRSSNVMPLVPKLKRVAEARLKGGETNNEIATTLRVAFDDGYDSVVLHNYTAHGGNPQDVIFVKNANQLRSRFAAFDPAKADSDDLLAARGAPPMFQRGESDERQMALDYMEKRRLERLRKWANEDPSGKL